MLLPPSSFFLLLAKSRGFFHLHVHIVSSTAKALLSISGLPTSYFKLFFSTSKSAFQLFTGTIRRCHSHLKCNRSPQEPTPSSSLLHCAASVAGKCLHWTRAVSHMPYMGAVSDWGLVPGAQACAKFLSRQGHTSHKSRFSGWSNLPWESWDVTRLEKLPP